MDQTKSYFKYCPPKSNSHGHAVRDKNVIRATKKLIEGFVDCFNATTDNKLQLILHYNKKEELDTSNKTIDKLNEFLGPSKEKWENTGYEHLIPDNTITWESYEKNILHVLAYIDQLNNKNFLPLAKYWIYCSYHYGKRPEPDGLVMCSIESGKLFIRLHLIFPYPLDNDKLYTLISKFQASMPFKLNSKHFRRLGPSKNGYGQWKLDEETQNKLDECLLKSRIK